MEREAVFDLSYLPLKIVLRAEHYAELPPYLGSALHGVIGQSLYRANRQAYCSFAGWSGGSGKLCSIPI